MGKRNESLGNPVSDLKGVGPRISRALAGRDIHTISDLISFLPLRYEDRREVHLIGELGEGGKAVVIARILTRGSLSFRRGRKSGYQVVVEDGTGMVALKWFRKAPRFLKEEGAKGGLLLVSGKVTYFGGQMQMIHPDVVPLGNEEEADGHKTIVPVYPEIDGVAQGVLRTLMKRAFEGWGDAVQSLIPDEVAALHGLVPLDDALRSLHFPAASPPLAGDGSGELKRLVVEEFFRFQMMMLLIREREGGKGTALCGSGRELCGRVKAQLPFDLTPAQQRVMDEIERDMSGQRPMNRLLQGDVGSGKTVLAVLASCLAAGSGLQTAFMAPTEILAEQHYLTLHRFFDSSDVSVAYLRGDMGKERREVLNRIKEGETSIVIGTHALIQKDVVFSRLGLVVVDEQHRFGVAQRRKLKQKGVMPHLLVMSATPIPRTLSLVLHGDLDVSVVDELPAGRQKITTHVYPDSSRDKAYAMIEGELGKGHQVYVVCPLVDESPGNDLPDATGMAAELSIVFAGRRIGLLHGRMRAEEKEGVMSSFKAGVIEILVCTTVIEVGIDVPNATLIVVEHAERFGLSQLHQLRGRVGRSAFASKCVLITAAKRTEQAGRRLRVMEKTDNGFAIAEEDLQIRGPGEMLGVRQSGVPGFRVGDLRRDGELMALAREMAVLTLEKRREEGMGGLADLFDESLSWDRTAFDLA